MATCPVCGESFTKAAYGDRFWANTDYQAHLRNTHPEYYSWQKRWTPISSTPVALIIVTILVLFLPGRNGSQPLVTNPLGVLIGFSVLGISAVIGVAMLPLRARSLDGFRRRWRESKDEKVVVSPELTGQSQGLEPSSALAAGASDDSILQATKQLRDQFNIDPTRFSPMRIEWLDYIPLPKGGQFNIPPDPCSTSRE